MSKYMLDDDRQRVKAGDTIHFSYGIPPIGVDARVVSRGGVLIALTPGHNPPEMTLREMKKMKYQFWKVKP